MYMGWRTCMWYCLKFKFILLPLFKHYLQCLRDTKIKMKLLKKAKVQNIFVSHSLIIPIKFQKLKKYFTFFFLNSDNLSWNQYYLNLFFIRNLMFYCTVESLNFVGANFVDWLNFTGAWGRNFVYSLIYLQKGIWL